MWELTLRKISLFWICKIVAYLYYLSVSYVSSWINSTIQFSSLTLLMFRRIQYSSLVWYSIVKTQYDIFVRLPQIQFDRLGRYNKLQFCCVQYWHFVIRSINVKCCNVVPEHSTPSNHWHVPRKSWGLMPFLIFVI